jgi:hypothetical protein
MLPHEIISFLSPSPFIIPLYFSSQFNEHVCANKKSMWKFMFYLSLSPPPSPTHVCVRVRRRYRKMLEGKKMNAKISSFGIWILNAAGGWSDIKMKYSKISSLSHSIFFISSLSYLSFFLTYGVYAWAYKKVIIRTWYILTCCHRTLTPHLL